MVSLLYKTSYKERKRKESAEEGSQRCITAKPLDKPTVAFAV
jgi:hypothetical protein